MGKIGSGSQFACRLIRIHSVPPQPSDGVQQLLCGSLVVIFSAAKSILFHRRSVISYPSLTDADLRLSTKQKKMYRQCIIHYMDT